MPLKNIHQHTRQGDWKPFLTHVGGCGQNASVFYAGYGGMGRHDDGAKGVNPTQRVSNPPVNRVVRFQYSVDRLGRERVEHAQTGGFMIQVGEQKTKPARNLKRKSQTLSPKGCATLRASTNAH